ncbi:DUF504 domain-containing protein [Candidatus Woesearchaeota archaeon]|nr:DUF504 domain-containing protein [Candidatus Woesearchaeota archaeon]
MITPERLKHYWWALVGVLGIVLFWAGIWDGIGGLPYLSNPFISLIVGVIVLAASGLILKEFDPSGEEEKKIHQVLHTISNHPQKHEFHIKYHDHLSKKGVIHHARYLKDIEKGFLIFVEKEGKEIFVPIHRVAEVLHKGKSYWKH